MTDDQINWAITEAIGADPHWKCAKDYCNDLNAMHEAEKALTKEQVRKGSKTEGSPSNATANAGRRGFTPSEPCTHKFHAQRHLQERFRDKGGCRVIFAPIYIHTYLYIYLLFFLSK